MNIQMQRNPFGKRNYIINAIIKHEVVTFSYVENETCGAWYDTEDQEMAHNFTPCWSFDRFIQWVETCKASNKIVKFDMMTNG